MNTEGARFWLKKRIHKAYDETLSPGSLYIKEIVDGIFDELEKDSVVLSKEWYDIMRAANDESIAFLAWLSERNTPDEWRTILEEFSMTRPEGSVKLMEEKK